MAQKTYASPDVIIEEIDNTSYSTSSSTTTGAIVMEAPWGPVNEATQINSIAQLKNTFGEPDENNYMDWFCARNYLNYSSSLQVVRVIETSTKIHYMDKEPTTAELGGMELPTYIKKNGKESIYCSKDLIDADINPAGQDGTFQAYYRLDDPRNNKNLWGMSLSSMILNYSKFEAKDKEGLPQIMARYPGALGSKIRVGMINTAGFNYIKKHSGDSTVDADDSPIYKLTKNHGWDVNGTRNEIACAVWTDNPATSDPIEFGYYSADEDGLSTTGYPNYIFSAVNKNSSYIYLNPTAFNSCNTTNPYNFYFDIAGKYDGDNTELTGVVWFDVQLYGGQDKSVKQDPKLLTTWSDTVEKNAEVITNLDKLGTDEWKDPIFTQKTDGVIAVIESGRVTALESGWDLFSNEETDDNYVNLLMQGSGNVAVGQYMIEQIAEQRQDCIACVSPMYWEVLVDQNNSLVESSDTIVQNMIEGSGSSYPNSSYAFMDGNFKYQYDSYNTVYRWVPLNGDIAGLFAYIDETSNPWYSIGNRQITNCTKLAFYPSKSQRDKMFDAFINPVTNFRNSGNVVYGDWTRKANSAFNFVGVRRTFLYLERTIKDYSRDIMFQQNDTVTSASFTQTVKPFLESVQDNRGIEEFSFKCGSDITSSEEIEQGIFKARITIKPVRSIRYIVLQFNAVRSDVTISEEE